jgi:PST family polysaccharide transporter
MESSSPRTLEGPLMIQTEPRSSQDSVKGSVVPGSLTAGTVSGAAWLMGMRTVYQIASLLTVAILARLLSPSAYGTMAMAVVLVNLATIVKDFGIPSAIVQRKAIDQRFLSSVFWMVLLFNTTITLTLFAAAPFVAAFFRQPEVEPLLRVLSVIFTINALSSVQYALLARELQTREWATIDTVALVVGYAASIIAALGGAGIWSLVVSRVVCSAVETLLIWTRHPWWPRLTIRREDIRTIAGFGVGFTGSGMLAYLSRNADNIIVGRFLGSTQLGLYQACYTLMTYPIQAVTAWSGVLFPAFSRLQDETARLQQAVLRAATCAALCFFPMIVGLTVTADLAVRCLLGPQWTGAGDVLRILAPIGLLQSATSVTGQIFVSQGRTDLMLRWGLASAVANVASFVVGLPWGIRGIALAYAAANVLMWHPVVAAQLRLIGLSPGALLKALGPTLGISLVMGAGALAWQFAMGVAGMSNPWYVLLSTSMVGAALYLVLLLIAWPAALDDLTHVLSSNGPAWLRRLAVTFRAVRVATRGIAVG